MTTEPNTSSRQARSRTVAVPLGSNSSKPAKGRIVFVPTDVHSNNGDDYAPAMITRVFDDGKINVRVFTDSTNPPEHRTSVTLHDEEPADRGHVAWWPPRA
jgi:hypothetical protein